MNKFFRSRLLALFTLIVFLPSCAVKSHQFADAVSKGELEKARLYHEPGFANLKFSLVSAPDKYALPIQYAILEKDKSMAKFLLDNGSTKTLNGKNLTYYCAYEGKHEMAQYFASIGEGSYSDISKAKNDIRQSNRRAEAGALIALGVLAVILSNSGSASGNGGLSDAEMAASLRADASISNAAKSSL